MHLDTLSDDPGISEAARVKLAAPLCLLRESIEESRRMISGLRPTILDEQGLVGAIEYLINEIPTEDVEIVFSHQDGFRRLDPVVEGSLFRIVQEAISNVRRHSQSKSAKISLSQVGDFVYLVIEDAGIGFELDATTARHFGLRGIRERASLLGGKATIRSKIGEGTRISLKVPINPVSNEPTPI